MERFIRTEWLIKPEGLAKLKASTVAIFGLGGVGAAAAEALARSNVGRLVIIDHDQVSLSNINRQLIALDSTVGLLKADVAQARIKDINSECEVIGYPLFYNQETDATIFAHQFDFVVDAIDSVAEKIDLIERCYRNDIPIISAMGAGNKLDPTQLQVEDIAKTHTCPLAKTVRLKLRKRGISRGVKTVFSPEIPLKVQRLENGRHSPGSIAFVPPVAGYIMASVVVMDLIGSF